MDVNGQIECDCNATPNTYIVIIEKNMRAIPSGRSYLLLRTAASFARRKSTVYWGELLQQFGQIPVKTMVQFSICPLKSHVSDKC